MKKKLTDKQLAFCREYVVDFNATQAVMRAGYSKNGARQTASKLVAKADIQLEVQKNVEIARNKVELTVERVLQEIMGSAFLDPVDVFNDDGSLKALSDMPEYARRAISGLEVATHFEGPRGGEKSEVSITKIKFADKVRSRDQLAKYLRMYADMEVNISLGLSSRLAAARKRAGSK